MLLKAFQKTVFYLPKSHLLACKKPPLAARKTTFLDTDNPVLYKKRQYIEILSEFV